MSTPTTTSDFPTQNFIFPTDFLWGAATAAFQIEGATSTDGRGSSIWDDFCRRPGTILGGDTGERAVDHYNRMPADVALMKKLGLKSYRFSVAWPRIAPNGRLTHTGPNGRGIDFYSRLVDELLANDIAPWVTLYHWDLPSTLEEKGGWTNRATAYYFTDYALALQAALGDRVEFWTTLNEPWCSAFLGYTAGAHAPGVQSPKAGLQAAHHLLLAHGLAAKELKANAPQAQVGITLNFTVNNPLNPDSESDRLAASRIDARFNRIFLDPIFKGYYPSDLLADLAENDLQNALEEVNRDGDLATISTPIDVLGVNYYEGAALSYTPPKVQLKTDAPIAHQTSSPYPAAAGIYRHSQNLPLTDMNWEVYPLGLYRLLHRLQDDYLDANTDLYITENGAAYDDVVSLDGQIHDQKRLNFIAAHLRATHRAISEGVRVKGYFAWSLLDNFEWAWGYSKRFGLVHVSYDSMERTIKDSGLWYSSVIAHNGFSDGKDR